MHSSTGFTIRDSGCSSSSKDEDRHWKGGVIKRITERTSPRIVRVVALPRPTERETTQWYFQRYIEHLPSAGEIVLFDRSWYSRSNVERVMGFCTEEQHQEFLRSCPEFERMLVRSGMKVLKYWFSVSWQEQRRRFEPRNEEPLKRWKLSDIDLEHRVADIDQLHRDWSSRGATFLTTPDRPGAETRCSMRDPDRHLLEVARRRGCSGRIDSQRWWVSHQPGRSALRPAEGSWR